LLNHTYVYEEGIANRYKKNPTPDRGDPTVEVSILKTISLTPALLDKQYGASAWSSVSMVLSHVLGKLGLSSNLTQAILDMMVDEIKTEFLTTKTAKSFDRVCLKRILDSSFWKSNLKKYPELPNQAAMVSVLKEVVKVAQGLDFTSLVSHAFYSIIPQDMKYKREGRATNKAKVTDAMQLFHKYPSLDMSKMEMLSASPWQAGATGEQSFMFLQEVPFNVAMEINAILKQDAFIWGVPNKGYPVMMYAPKDDAAHMPAGSKLLSTQELAHDIETSQSVSTDEARKDFVQVDGGNPHQLFTFKKPLQDLLKPKIILDNLKTMLSSGKYKIHLKGIGTQNYEEDSQLLNFESIAGTLPSHEYHTYMTYKFMYLGGNNGTGLSYGDWLDKQVPNKPVSIDVSHVPTMHPNPKGGWQPSSNEADHLRVGALNGGAFQAYHYLMNIDHTHNYRLVEKKYSVGIGGSFGLNLYQAGSTVHDFHGHPMTFEHINAERLEMGHLPISTTL